MKIWIQSILWLAFYLIVFVSFPQSFFATSVAFFIWILYSIAIPCTIVILLLWDKIDIQEKQYRFLPAIGIWPFIIFSIACNGCIAVAIANSGRPILGGVVLLSTLLITSIRIRLNGMRPA